MVWFTEADLRGLAGDRSYERGLGYVEVVSGVAELPDGVVAVVHGRGRYEVRLTGCDGGVLDGECTCPYGEEGNFCKHCVAVGLRLLREAGSGNQPRARGMRHVSTPQADVKTFLSTLDRSELVEVVWQHATEDATLFRKLRLLAATEAAVPDLAELRGQVARLRAEWIAYGDEHSYARAAEEVLDALDRLVPKHAAAVQPLLRAALDNIGVAAGVAEDESGAVIDVASAAWAAYLRACAAAPPDPVEFARWYVDFGLGDQDWPDTSLDDVVDLLGEKGLAAYRERLDEAMQTHAGHWRLRQMREELVAATGDTDAMVACLAENLSSPHQYVRIAELLRAEARIADAIDWLERGVAAAGGGQHGHLTTMVDLLAELYTESGRDADALALREKHFMATGSEQAYRALRTAALDDPQWPEIRERALALLRQRADGRNWYAADTFAAVLLDEGEVDEAWQVTQAHSCGGEVRMAVTARRAQTHPADAIEVYRPLAEAAIAETNNRGYERATQLLLLMRPLFARTGGDFVGYVNRLKETNRRKRNFLAELARNGL